MRTPRASFLGPRAATLRGEHVLLQPISRRDASELSRVPDDEGWELLLRRPAGGLGAGRATGHGGGDASGATDATSEQWLDDALHGVRRGTERCWTIRDAVDGRLLGSTRYLNIDVPNARLEIGATWLLPEARGSVANAESKLLLIDYAVDVLGVRRVHIQADVRNARSRRAIEALGATFEGTLREHIVLADGTSRDTAVYSILASEWPALRTTLAARVAARAADWRGRASSLLPVETPAAHAAFEAVAAALPITVADVFAGGDAGFGDMVGMPA